MKQQEAKSKATKADPAQVKKLTAVVDRKRVDYEKAAETAGVLQAEVDEITKEIKEKTTGKMKAVDKSINEVTKTIDKCKAEITRLRVAITTSERFIIFLRCHSFQNIFSGILKKIELTVLNMKIFFKDLYFFY